LFFPLLFSLCLEDFVRFLKGGHGGALSLSPSTLSKLRRCCCCCCCCCARACACS
jgi:hypothetical protein